MELKHLRSFVLVAETESLFNFLKKFTIIGEDIILKLNSGIVGTILQDLRDKIYTQYILNSE